MRTASKWSVSFKHTEKVRRWEKVKGKGFLFKKERAIELRAWQLTFRNDLHCERTRCKRGGRKGRRKKKREGNLRAANL